MRAWLISSKPWVVYVADVLVFGVCWTLMTGNPGIWRTAALFGVFAGLVLGLIAARGTVRSLTEERDVLRLSAPHDLRVAARAADSGPVPERPELRDACRRLVRHRLDELNEGRVTQLLILGVCIVALSVFTVTSGRWWCWSLVLVGAWSFVGLLRARTLLERRAELLDDERTNSSGSTATAR